MSTKATPAKRNTKKPKADAAAAEPSKTKGKKAAEPVADPTVASGEVVEKKQRKHRDVSKETVDANFQTVQARVEAEIAKLRDSQEKVRGIKFLRSINKAIKTLHSDTKRVMKLKKKNNRKRTVVSGFLKLVHITPELAQFTGWEVDGTYSRVKVTKFICDYIRANKLFDEKDKRRILCDDKLKNLLKYDPNNLPLDDKGLPAELNYFRLQKYLKPHFIKIIDEVKPEADKTAAATEDKKPAKAAKPAAAAKAKPAAAKPTSAKAKSKKVELEDSDEGEEATD